MLFTHHVYNSQGRCLKGLDLPKGASPQEAVDAYLAGSGGVQTGNTVLDEGAYDGLYAFFTEELRGKEYRRFIVPAAGSDRWTATCDWFLGCGNVADRRMPHPAFPDGVLTCATHVAWLEEDGSWS